MTERLPFKKSLPTGKLLDVPGKLWTIEEDNEAEALLRSGVSASVIAAKLGRSRQAVSWRNHAKWRVPALEIWQTSREDRWTSEEDTRGIAMLAETRDYDLVSSALGRSRMSVKLRNALRWHVRMFGLLSEKSETFFGVWSPVMAYVLGFIAADGNVVANKKTKQYVLTISQSHEFGREHLERMQKLLGGSVHGPCKDDGFQLRVHSKTTVTRLMELGIHPAKSLTLEMPAVPDPFFRPFLLGVFDGDGCVSRSNKREQKPDLRASIASGSKLFLEALAWRIEAVTGLTGKVGRWELTFRQVAGRAFLSWLYEEKEDALWLPRKYARYRELLTERVAWGDRRRGRLKWGT